MPILTALRANIAATLFGLLAATLLAISVYQAVQIHGFLWVDGLNDKLEDCARDRNELRAISNAKNEQAETTRGNIKQAERGNREADRAAREIEEAPVAPDCATPPQVMGADL